MAVRDSAQKTMSIATQIASVTHRFGAITPKEPLAIVAMSVSMGWERSRRRFGIEVARVSNPCIAFGTRIDTNDHESSRIRNGSLHSS
jgi:hypothetical protein